MSKPKKTLADRVHGKRETYSRYGCRCDLCRAENARVQRESRDRAREQFKAAEPDDPRHGYATTYEYYGCRCQSCRAAKYAAETLLNSRRAARIAQQPRTPRATASFPDRKKPLPAQIHAEFDLDGFAREITAYMFRNQLNQRATAHAVQVNVRTLREMLQGVRMPSITAAARLAVLCDLHLDKFVKESPSDSVQELRLIV